MSDYSRWRRLAAELMEIFPADADAYRGAVAAAAEAERLLELLGAENSDS